MPSPLHLNELIVTGVPQHLPFKWPGEKKGRFALKVFAYMFTGFSIPFLAAEYQMCVVSLHINVPNITMFCEQEEGCWWLMS
jgi:hypothetical protein